MPDRFTPDEFEHLMAPWDPKVRAIAQQRLDTNFARERLENFTAAEAATMRAALKRLIPEDEGIDLTGFIDWAIDQPMGRGDRQPGMPGELDVFRLGLLGLDEAAQERHQQTFRELDGGAQDALLAEVENGSAPGAVWRRIPSNYFFSRFYGKALHGYLAHPKVWMRIGFMGASYPEGYTWLSRGEVKQRHERQIGWDRL